MRRGILLVPLEYGSNVRLENDVAAIDHEYLIVRGLLKKSRRVANGTLTTFALALASPDLKSEASTPLRCSLVSP